MIYRQNCPLLSYLLKYNVLLKCSLSLTLPRSTLSHFEFSTQKPQTSMSIIVYAFYSKMGKQLFQLYKNLVGDEGKNKFSLWSFENSKKMTTLLHAIEMMRINWDTKWLFYYFQFFWSAKVAALTFSVILVSELYFFLRNDKVWSCGCCISVCRASLSCQHSRTLYCR